MQESVLILVSLTSIVGFAILAKRFKLPYPIVFVIGGALIALFPNLPSLELKPEWVFLIFLPPLLYSGGWFTDWPLFRENLRPISLLAFGLVGLTTVVVAVAAHALIPNLPWPSAFVLGAIISPPDAVAAGAVFERFPVPRRIAAILDGEGLVNDATALVIYRFAIAAGLTGLFSPQRAAADFVMVAAGGIAVGIAIAYAYIRLEELLNAAQLNDYQLANTASLIVPYAIYLTAESVHVSGVLAVVAAGIFVSRKSNRIFDPESRLVAYAIWDIFIFLLNGLVFLLIGLQVRGIVRDPSFALRELSVGLLISLLVIVVRFVWVYPATYIPRAFIPSIRRREGIPSWNYVFVIAWSGMRGIVTLAGALAIPLTVNGNQPFPGRNEIVFISLCVVFVTLVVQGLSLIPLLKVLRIDSGDDSERREVDVRVAALKAGIARLRQLEPDFDTTTEWEIEGRLLNEYKYRIDHLKQHALGGNEQGGVAIDHRLQTEALDAERREILRMRAAGEIPDDIFRKIEYDLDLASTRIS